MQIQNSLVLQPLTMAPNLNNHYRFQGHGSTLAVSHFGPRLFGMRHFGTDISVPETFRYRDISVPGTFRPRDISAPETFRYRDISVPWTFRYRDISVPETFRYRDISVPGHFGTGDILVLEISVPETFWYRDISVLGILCRNGHINMKDTYLDIEYCKAFCSLKLWFSLPRRKNIAHVIWNKFYYHC